MYRYLPFLIVILLYTSSCKEKFSVENDFKYAEKQTELMLKMLGNNEKMPRTYQNDSLATVDIKDWTSGFFPGVLWYLYEYTNNKFWEDVAKMQTEKLNSIQFFNGNHDIGFMMYCSYGNGLRLGNDTSYRQILINSADMLSSRFNKKAGVIRSWDFHKSRNNDEWYCPVIIDNMMNLELLFFAYNQTGNEYYKQIAISHADSTMKYHIRPDYSCYHVVNYDTISGKMTGRGTHQGYDDNSAWARGQSWAIYGFTVMYRETKNQKYLNTAEHLADFYLNNPNLPDDLVPYWDFNSPDIPNTSKDVSAAAVTASALIELSNYSTKAKVYFDSAEKILKSLSSNYTTKNNQKNPFILGFSVGNFPRGTEVDVPLNYTDYYFLEGLLRYKSKTKKTVPN